MEGGGMRALKIVTIGMGVLILVGMAVIIVTIVKRATSPAAGPAGVPGETFATVLNEPAGSAIVGIAQVRDRLAVQLRGGGLDRVLLIDPASGAVVGTISLARQAAP
jgi:hypothetical protein